MTFNGQDSWLSKYVDSMRAYTDKKFAEVLRPSRGGVSNGRPLNPPCTGEPMLTPQVRPARLFSRLFFTRMCRLIGALRQMRFHFYDNARKLDATELTELKGLAMRKAPGAVHSLENGEVKRPAQHNAHPRFIRRT